MAAWASQRYCARWLPTDTTVAALDAITRYLLMQAEAVNIIPILDLKLARVPDSSSGVNDSDVFFTNLD